MIIMIEHFKNDFDYGQDTEGLSAEQQEIIVLKANLKRTETRRQELMKIIIIQDQKIDRLRKRGKT